MRSRESTGASSRFQAYLMCHFTFVIYVPDVPTIDVDAERWGWNLVGYAESLPTARHEASVVSFHDHAALFQHPRTL
eukprot:g17604.t1